MENLKIKPLIPNTRHVAFFIYNCADDATAQSCLFARNCLWGCQQLKVASGGARTTDFRTETLSRGFIATVIPLNFLLLNFDFDNNESFN
ncbi:MAG: hypothetical protein ICV81_21285 [Flavisolibacter sp.]|nr:hypothetical protein [Flavisolibacter sp.]